MIATIMTTRKITKNIERDPDWTSLMVLMTALESTFMGSALGPMRGRDGNVHRGRPRESLLPMISHLGAMIAVVNGVLFARRMKNLTGFVGTTTIGDGGTSTGHFTRPSTKPPWRSSSGADRRQQSVCLLDPHHHQFACSRPTDKAIGYGVASHELDGTDPAACLEVVGRAVSQARDGEGPQMVVARCCACAVTASTTTPAMWTRVSENPPRPGLPGRWQSKLCWTTLGRSPAG